MNCILIDDDQDDQEIFMMALAQINRTIQCTAVNDGIEGLRVLREPHAIVPDFIFIDVNMPRMQGMQVLVEIRKIAKFNATKVVMFSTFTDSLTIQNSKKLGADEFVIKPAGFKLFVEVLAGIFNNDVIR